MPAPRPCGEFIATISDSLEARAVVLWKSLQLAQCAQLSVDLFSDPRKSVLMPWPSLLNSQFGRVNLLDESKINIVGRQFFRVLHLHAVENRKSNITNVMGTKGIGKSHRLAALAGLLLQEVIFFVYFVGTMLMIIISCAFVTGQFSCDILATLWRFLSQIFESHAFSSDGCFW
jgi:hypothetical protein